MVAFRFGKSGFVSWVVAAALLGASVLVTILLWLLGDWENHRWGLELTLRIVWGCWLVGSLAAILTRVTIFGWYFRRYFYSGEVNELPPEVPNLPPPPWPKSGKASFSITVVLVSLTGATAVATAVLWILRDSLGEGWLWLLLKIIWALWWVLCIATVLTRVAIFGIEKKRIGQGSESAAPGQPAPEANDPVASRREPSRPRESSNSPEGGTA